MLEAAATDKLKIVEEHQREKYELEVRLNQLKEDQVKKEEFVAMEMKAQSQLAIQALKKEMKAREAKINELTSKFKSAE